MQNDYYYYYYFKLISMLEIYFNITVNHLESF